MLHMMLRWMEYKGIHTYYILYLIRLMSHFFQDDQVFFSYLINDNIAEDKGGFVSYS